MAVLYAKAAGGNWSAAGTWSATGSGGGDSAGPPVAGTDVIFEAGSGAVTIDAGAVCRSLNCASGTGTYAGTLTHSAAVTLTIGDGTAGAGNVAIKLVSGMTYTFNTVTSIIVFGSTSSTQQTITTGTKSMSNLTFSGVGSSYVLADSLTLPSSTLTVSNGIFDSGNQAISAINFISTSGLTRTLTLGSSTITTASSSAWNTNNITGLTMTANTAVVTLTTTTTMTLCNNTFNFNGLSVVCTGTGTFTIALGGSPTINNLTYNGSAAKTNLLRFTSATTLNITGTLTVTGQSLINRMLVSSTIVGSAATLNVTTGKSFSNVDWMDVTAAGTQAPFTGTSMGNALGNTSITFDAPATQTHTAAAGGNWSDASVWTSRVPLPQDNVVINASTTGTITADMPRLGANIDFTGFAGTASFASVANSSYGNWTFASGMTISGTQALSLSGRSAQTITCNTQSFSQAVTLAAPSGTYTLQDAFITSGILTVNQGTIDANNFNLTCSAVNSNSGVNVRGITMGTGTWTFTAAGTTNVWNTTATGGLTFSGASATMVIAGGSANTKTFGGGGLTFGTLTYTVAGSTGTLVITGSNTFSTLNFSDVTNARTLQFTAGTTTTILAAFNVNGTSGKLMSIQSATAATHTLSKPTSFVSCNYLSITNSIAGGGATWYAGANSTDVSGNTGWVFNAPPAGRGGFLPFFFR